MNTQHQHQGQKDGIEKGIVQGKEQGIQQEKRNVVIKMLKEKMPIELIEKITGLSEKEILNIEKSIC